MPSSLLYSVAPAASSVSTPIFCSFLYIFLYFALLLYSSSSCTCSFSFLFLPISSSFVIDVMCCFSSSFKRCFLIAAGLPSSRRRRQRAPCRQLGVQEQGGRTAGLAGRPCMPSCLRDVPPPAYAHAPPPCLPPFLLRAAATCSGRPDRARTAKKKDRKEETFGGGLSRPYIVPIYHAAFKLLS